MEAASSHRCRRCGGALSDPFYRLDDRPVCEACTQAEGDHAGPAPGQMVLGGIAGLIAGSAVSFVMAWGYMRVHSLLGLLCIVVGLAIGGVMLKLAGGRSNTGYQVIGVIAAALSIFLGYVVFNLAFPNHLVLNAPSASSPLPLAFEEAFRFWDLFDWVFLAIAAFEAWSILRPTAPARVEGPYPLSSLEPVEPSR